MSKKILIVHLVTNGDCLMATTIARQVKAGNPGGHLTWAISHKCKQVIENNPDIDTIWEIKCNDIPSALGEVWYKVKTEAEERKLKGEFDEIIYSQIAPDNYHHFDGTTRSSTFRAYPKPITVDVTPAIKLYDKEIENVKTFAEKYQLEKYKHVVLCECAPASGQSFLNVAIMLQLTQSIVKEREDIIFIISTHLKIESGNNRIIDASQISYRENAELSKYCTLLIGCSSGITWLLTSNWAKRTDTIQFLNKTNIPFGFASVAYDFKYWRLPASHIIESTEKDINKMKTIVDAALSDFNEAKNIYNEELKPSLKMLKRNIRHLFFLYSLKGMKKIYYCMNIFFERNNVNSFDRFAVRLLVMKLAIKERFRK